MPALSGCLVNNEHYGCIMTNYGFWVKKLNVIEKKIQLVRFHCSCVEVNRNICCKALLLRVL